jgi:hypothetical protein
MMISEPVAQLPNDVVPRRARIDVISGAVIVSLAGLIWLGGTELEVGTIANFGSGAIPKILALVLLVGGCALLLKGLTQDPEDAERFHIASHPMVIVLVSIGLFGVFIRGGDFGVVSTPQLGLLIVGPLTVFVSGCATPNLHVKSLLVLSFGLTAGILMVFVDLLGVSIPIAPRSIQNDLSMSVGFETMVRAAYATYGVIAVTLYVALVRRRGGCRE